ncbi:hypothetical protein ACHAW6_000650 [Cyclotella cf. meneghiniana]
MSPSKHLYIDCFPDADFAGLYHHDDSKILTVFVAALDTSSLLLVALSFEKASTKPKLPLLSWRLNMLLLAKLAKVSFSNWIKSRNLV